MRDTRSWYAGRASLTLNMTWKPSRVVGAGVYFVRLEAGGRKFARRLALVT